MKSLPIASINSLVNGLSVMEQDARKVLEKQFGDVLLGKLKSVLDCLKVKF